MKQLNLYIIAILLCTASCTKYRTVPNGSSNVTPPPTNGIGLGSLVINEYISKGNVDPNEFGVPCKWFEIYNAGSFAITLDTNFYLSDTIGIPDKFQLPVRDNYPVIRPHEFFVFWCDNMDTATAAKDIHTNFSLSSKGESICISYMKPGGNLITIDSLTFGPNSNSGISTGRFPDGTGPMNERGMRTPGQPNVQ